MAALNDLLSWLDARKRVFGSNVRDIAQNPVAGIGSLLSGMNDDARQYNRKLGGLLGEAGSVIPQVREAGREGLLGEVMNVAPMGIGAIKAYHGSPHKFDKFDLSKIGTGEGAQAYGHGAYFAENPNTAWSYLNPGGFDDHLAEVNGLSAKAYGLLDDYADASTSPKKWLQQAREAAKKDPHWSDIVDELNKVKPSQLKLTPGGGNLYDVNLRWPDPAREAADPLGPQHFLDWDKPLSEQPKDIQAALTKLGLEPTGRNADMLGQKVVKEAAINNASAPHPFAYRLPPSPTGAAQKAGYGSGDKAASAYLRDLGIPGIRYLDAGSRGAGEGTANYVVFDDALIEILRRNGMAP